MRGDAKGLENGVKNGKNAPDDAATMPLMPPMLPQMPPMMPQCLQLTPPFFMPDLSAAADAADTIFLFCSRHRHATATKKAAFDAPSKGLSVATETSLIQPPRVISGPLCCGGVCPTNKLV